MPILYDKQEPKTTFSSLEEASGQAYLKDINLRMADTGTTRCLGSALDACKYDYRTALGRSVNKHGSIRYKGENDDVIDAWNMLDVVRNSEDLVLLYDRERDGELNKSMLETLPENTMIGTGNANRRGYIDADNPQRSQHAIVTIGTLTNGRPIVYDLGKVYEGVPDKYVNQINYIAIPREQLESYKRPPMMEQVPITQEVVEAPPVRQTPTDFDSMFKAIGPADDMTFITGLLSLIS